MAIDYSQRPAGMSKREYAASVLGGSKEDYSSSGDKKSSGSSSSSKSSSSDIYKAKSYDYKDFLDTSRVDTAFGSAKDTFLGQLTALKPRYEELYKQLEAEKTLTAEKEAKLSAQEGTQQKVNIAKRGIAVDTDNPFYTAEAGKLASEQGMRSKETALQFAGKRLDISGAQSADERDLNTAIANLDLNKASTIENLVEKARNIAETRNTTESNRAYQSKLDSIAAKNAKSKAESDRALALYDSAKSAATSKNESYNTALATLYIEAMSNATKPYQREIIANQLKARFPGMEAQINRDIAKYFPDGWESKSSGGNNANFDESGFNI